MMTTKKAVLTCEGCNAPANDLPALMTMNGVTLHVCDTCATWMEQMGAVRADAAGQGALWS